MAKLDRSRPVGDIYGTYAEKPLARYTQDGKFFDAKGNHLLSDDERAIEIEAARKALAELEALKEPVVPPVDIPVPPVDIPVPPVDTPVPPVDTPVPPVDTPVPEEVKPPKAAVKKPALPKLPE